MKRATLRRQEGILSNEPYHIADKGTDNVYGQTDGRTEGPPELSSDFRRPVFKLSHR